MEDLREFCKQWIIANLDDGEDFEGNDGASHFMKSKDIHEFVQEMLDDYEDRKKEEDEQRMMEENDW